MSMRASSSHLAAGALAAALSAIVTYGLSHGINLSLAQGAPGLTQLLVQPLSDLPGREVRITLLDREPGASSGPHRHPGHHTFGYVIQGSYEFAVNGERPRTLKAGDVFYEPPSAVHSTSRNPSAQDQTRIIVFMVADQKNPSTVSLPPP